jgi:hypothetical protein
VAVAITSTTGGTATPVTVDVEPTLQGSSSVSAPGVYELEVSWANQDGTSVVRTVGDIHLQSGTERIFYFYKASSGGFEFTGGYPGNVDAQDADQGTIPDDGESGGTTIIS